MRSQASNGGRGGKKTAVPSRVSKNVLKNSELTKTYKKPSRILFNEGILSQRGYAAAKKKASRSSSKKK